MNPSLLLIPDRYKAAKLYSQIPDTGAGDLDFTRVGDTATRVNASGLIEPVLANIPRIDYTGGGCGKLLLEPQRTNISTYNETNAGNWGAATPSASGSILGVNAFEVSTNLGIGDAPHNQMAAEFLANATYSASVIVDFNSININLDFSLLIFTDAGIQARGILVNKTTKTATNTGGGAFSSVVSSSVIQLDGEIYKVTLTVNFAAGLTGITGSRCYCFDSTNLSTVRFAALQVEQGGYATSYIYKTTSATVTRGADVASKTGISSLIGQTEGTLYWEGYANPSNAFNSLASVEVKGVSFINLRLNALNIIEIGTNGLSTDFTVAATTPVVLGTYYKIAGAYKSGQNVLYINGVQVGTDATTFTAATLSQFRFNVWDIFDEQKSTGQALLFKTRLSNADLASLTA